MASVELVYESHGEPGGIPLIIVHGFLAAARNWRTVAKRLAANRHVYVLDMRNHGSSPQAESLDYPSMAGDLIAFMDRLGIAAADLLGHSMGGKAVMWLALQYPQRVANLIVADIAPVSYQHSFDALIDALGSLPVASIGNRKQAEAALADAIPDLAYRQFLLQNLLLKDGQYYWRIDLDVMRRNAHHIVGFPDAETATFAGPALFIGGERSKYIDAQAVYRAFPTARIRTIPDTGHWLYVEAPEAFCRLVEDWLSVNS
ncbi:alpha/beta fold hydrolase [Methylomonas koyamae]|uniref:alpha/beta fold hydrolase n=1 Tax=Methylomonas koyamae TaxID=702114 RepID=UPI000BC32D19|nr:alpha/beta fold hydrolase [Methylomonas koyamae]ATG88989.1 alpha/beta hydrolase [Methylomonas koyamae]